MGQQEPKEDNVIYLHSNPKFLERWAKQFAKLHRTQGKENAIQWGMAFLPKQAVKPVVERVKRILGTGPKGVA